MQSTVMFTLPEGRQGSYPESILFSWQEDEEQYDGSTKKRRRHDGVSISYVGKTVDKSSNLVTRTRWRVYPRGHWPKELGALQEIIFEA